MIVDFTTQLPGFFWMLSAVLTLLAVLLFASLDPELIEVYVGEGPLFVAAVALAVLVFTLSGQVGHFIP